MRVASQSTKVVRSRWFVVFTLCTTAVALSSLVAPGAAATAHPTATKIKSVVVSGLPAPEGAPNNPSAIVVADTDFSVTVNFTDNKGKPLPLSWTDDVTVVLSVEPPAAGQPPSDGGDAQFVGANTILVPAGATSATGSGFQLSPAENRIRIGAVVDWGDVYPKAIPKAFSAQFDVVARAITAPPEATFISTSGSPSECSVTTYAPYCLDLHLPFGTESGSVLTVGTCDAFLGCSDPDQVVVQALADLGPSYSRTSPMTAVYKCDKAVCTPKLAAKKFHVFVSLAATGPLAKAPACTARGVVNAGKNFCLDYQQSVRDSTGDLQLYLLLARDARMSCC
jgi:hypothetical protein